MKIAVAIKQVPDTETKIIIAGDGRSIDGSNVTMVVNPYDEYALEEALRIKDTKGSGEVVVLTAGGEKSVQALRTCLAIGADRAVHVKDPAVETADALALAKILSAAMKEIGPDLILTGKYAVGTDNQLIGPMIAEILGIPHVGVVTKLQLGDGTLTAEREIEGAIEVVTSTLPCVITAQKGLNEPRYASLKGIMAAKKKPLDERTISALGLDPGLLAPRVVWEKLELPPKKTSGKVLKGDENPAAAARELVRLLHEEAKVI